jgi:hypothetical protein
MCNCPLMHYMQDEVEFRLLAPRSVAMRATQADLVRHLVSAAAYEGVKMIDTPC